MFQVEQVSIEKAEKIFEKFGFTVFFWNEQKMENGKYDGMICDYSSLPGYKVKYACEVWDPKNNKLVARFNVMK